MMRNRIKSFMYITKDSTNRFVGIKKRKQLVSRKESRIQ